MMHGLHNEEKVGRSFLQNKLWTSIQLSRLHKPLYMHTQTRVHLGKHFNGAFLWICTEVNVNNGKTRGDDDDAVDNLHLASCASGKNCPSTLAAFEQQASVYVNTTSTSRCAPGYISWCIATLPRISWCPHKATLPSLIWVTYIYVNQYMCVKIKCLLIWATLMLSVRLQRRLLIR